MKNSEALRILGLGGMMLAFPSVSSRGAEAVAQELELQQVVVTAQRREQGAQDVGISVSV